MKEKFLILSFSLCLLYTGCSQLFPPQDESSGISTIADHSIVRRLYDRQIAEAEIQRAVDDLHIGYGHTSHGSQITDGMSGLAAFADNNFTEYRDDLFQWSRDGSAGLHFYEGDGYGDGDLDHDCGYTGWDDETREFLNDVNNGEFNVIMWSWCGQVDSVDIDSHYLDRMEALETDYPDVTFIYMTGHLEGGSDDPENNAVLAHNNAIRDYCREKGKWLFDFADIEKYDLDGSYFGDKLADDGCNYDSTGDGSRDANWAVNWQQSHTKGEDWYSCGAAHSQPVNANQKAYAAWWLFTQIARSRGE